VVRRRGHLARLESDELADPGRVPPDDVLIADHDDRNAHQTERLQLLEGRGVLLDVPDVELDAAPRKQGFRHGAAASPRARVDLDQIRCDHVRNLTRDSLDRLIDGSGVLICTLDGPRLARRC
jgi:hypothetical protein